MIAVTYLDFSKLRVNFMGDEEVHPTIERQQNRGYFLKKNK